MVNKGRGKDYYALAKEAEYVHRDLDEAIRLYMQALAHDQKVESAIKDLAALFHQKGETARACRFLKEMRPRIRGDLKKYDNLLHNLSRQIVPSGKFLNKSLLLVDCPLATADVLRLFEKASRVEEVLWFEDLALDPPLAEGRHALVRFQSYSSAKKTLETVLPGTQGQMFWVNVNMLLVAMAYPLDTNFYSFYHGDSVWDWALTLPEEKPVPCPFKWGNSSPSPLALDIRRAQNETKLEALRAGLD
jgi:hypothetical protein